MDATGQPEETAAETVPLPLEEVELGAEEIVDAPRQKSERPRVALCLSGGGFRAALFHLGALRRLSELGLLSRVDTISSVSGGSIVAAHLAERIRTWPTPGEPVSNWEERVAVPFRDFTRKNLCTGPLLRRYLLPWNWLKPATAVEALALRYEDVTRLRLTELPHRPRFVFCATDMVFGVNWVFTKDQAGDYQVGYLGPAPPWPVARAIAASFCFPPIFNPLPLQLKPDQLSGGQAARRPDYTGLVEALRLTDGGVYDNMGLEPVWKDHDMLLVSDGGATFAFDPAATWVQRLRRYTAIIDNQSRSIRKRWLIASFRSGRRSGALWSIGSVRQDQGDDPPIAYRRHLVEEMISRIRTDMDAFSSAEIAVLENHGYVVADAALKQYAPDLVPSSPAPLTMPHPQWIDEARVRQALKQSHKRKLPLGRW